MELDFSSEKSIFMQIAQVIENDIVRDALCSDEQVPSTNALARFYSVNPSTAAKSLAYLMQENILYEKRGVGMFVTKEAKTIILAKRKEVFINQFIKPLADEAKILGITTEEIVLFIQEEVK